MDKYSVLAIAQVREKMMNEIDQISEVFSVSKSDATVILIHLRWNSFKASDLLGDNKEKFLAELGLVHVVGSDSSSSSADLLVSTPFCCHKYSKTRWIIYLEDCLKKAGRGVITCVHEDCLASVGPDTIEKLTKPAKEMYEEYILGSFLESNKATIKRCPAGGDCHYAIELNEEKEADDEIAVVCLCGYIFCWSCEIESHKPVTCNNASLWSSYVLGQSRSFSWLHKNTKRCPNCDSRVQQNGDPDYKLITCICSWKFCWVCLKTEEEHHGLWNCVEVSVPVPENEVKADDPTSKELNQILHLNLWDSNHANLVKAKSNLKFIEKITIPDLMKTCALSDQDIRAVREAWMLVVQCRLVLKWSVVCNYFISEYQSAKKEYLNHRGDEANAVLYKHEMTINELTSQAFSERDFARCKHRMETSTTTTGNFFHDFVKDLENGLPDVTADANENAPKSQWICDRCTFENSWLDKQCMMCFVPKDSTPHVASDDNNPTSVSDGQEVPDVSMSDPLSPDQDIAKSD